jgi:hypothetical protein
MNAAITLQFYKGHPYRKEGNRHTHVISWCDNLAKQSINRTVQSGSGYFIDGRYMKGGDDT